MIVSVLNQKGGSGKTTIAINIAACLKSMGKSVIVIDTDEQGTARDWHMANEAETLQVLGLDRPTFDKDLKSLYLPQEWVVIDGSPRLSAMAAKAAMLSDIILIPVQPSPYDVWATKDFVEIIKSCQVMNPKIKAYFVISRKITNTLIGEDVVEALASYEIPVFISSTSQRIIYAVSASAGKTVLDYVDTRAIGEIKAITEEVIACTLS